MRGAGGTEGGIGSFFLGLTMMIAGGYLFLESIQVVSHFGMGYRLYSIGGFGLTSGMVMVPFVFGVGLLFYNGKNPIGWILMLGSLVMLGFGVVSSIDFRFRNMSAFELITILVLMVGGLGIFLRSLKSFSTS